MFSSGMLGVAIGLVLVFLLVSWISSGISELVDVVLKRRAKNLEAAILDLLGPTLKRRLSGKQVEGGQGLAVTHVSPSPIWPSCISWTS
jgi:hypothetical protein